MANIKIALDYTIIDGQPLSFKAPCDCTAVSGIKVEYPDGENMTSTVFSFADAHGNALAGIGNLFTEGAMVRVLLDIGSQKAYIQNADTNAYLEAQLASKAPAGYGLGETNGKFCNNPNNAIKPGFYYLSGESCVNVPIENTLLNYGTLFVERRHTTIHQSVSRLNVEIKRHSEDTGSTWSEWEWVNPPLTIGVEYRTTERSEGKPVYVKRISVTCDKDISALSTGTNIYFAHGISNFGKLVRCHGVMDGAYPLPHISHRNNGSASIISVNNVNGTNVAVSAINIDRAAPNFVFDIAYCKS